MAPALGLLVAGRALRGVAAAVMVPSSLSLIAHTFPEPRERAKAVGIWIGSSGIAASAGPLLGGLLVGGLSWRAVFVVCRWGCSASGGWRPPTRSASW